MIPSLRLAAAPVLAAALAAVTLGPAHASTGSLSSEAIGALAVSACQVDADAPLSLDELDPVVVAEADVEVVPGEITAHLVRAQVNTSLGDVEECTFGVLHRDALLPRVQYQGTATLTLADGAGGTAQSAETDFELGNMGKGNADPTAEVALEGFLAPLDSVVAEPAYAVSVDRKALEVVPIAVNRAQKDAADKLLKVQLKAAAQLEKKQLKAAKSKHSAKATATAKAAYAKRVATAQAVHDRATAPKTVTRPVSHTYSASGTVAAS